MNTRQLAAGLLVAAATILLAVSASAKPASGAFDKLHCLKYAGATVPITILVAGAKPADIDASFMICVARRAGQTIVLDAGYVDQAYGAAFGVSDWTDLADRLKEVGVDPAEVDLVTLGHLHWDHAGGTSRFPKAKFVLQRRELESAALDVAGNSSFVTNGFRLEEIVDTLKLKWDGRVELVDGDAEGWRDGIDLYLTPGHTAGTMTVCLATTKGRVCYTSDAVYLYRNLEENLPLGLALDPVAMFESFAKIRRVLRGGTLLPGHDVSIFENAKALGFRRVSERVVAIVE